MKKYLIALIICVSLFCFSATASEVVTASTEYEPEILTENTSEPETEPGSEISLESEAGNESEENIIDGLYARGRQWVEDNPVLFTNISTALAVIVYGMTQLIGHIGIKKPVVKASNNAVEICTKTEENVENTYREMKKIGEEMIKRTEKLGMDMVRETGKIGTDMIQEAIGALNIYTERMESIQRNSDKQLRVIRHDREAVLLMARVVGRLLEESSLPARTRDEIHTMMAEAQALLDLSDDNGSDEEAGEEGTDEGDNREKQEEVSADA